MKKTITISFLALLLIVSFVGCSGKTITQEETLVVGTSFHNGLYNGLYATTAYDDEVVDLVYEKLVIDTPDGIAKPNPRLVEHLEVSKDNKEYIFSLNKEITFSTKKPLTAKDVVFTYQVLADPSSTAYRHNWSSDFVGGNEYMNGTTQEFPGIEALDEYTVRFTFTDNNRTNLSRCGVPILSEEYYPSLEIGQADFIMHEKMSAPVGSGPYVLTEYVPSERAVLQKNPNYWAEKETDYKIKQIEIRFLSKNDQLTALEEGSIDFIPKITDKDSVAKLYEIEDNPNAPKLDATVYQRNSYGFFGFNTDSGSSEDETLRQAIAYAFDKNQFVEEYFGELGVPVIAPIPYSSDLYSLIATDLNPYDYNIEQGRELLVDKGYTFDSGLVDPSGEKVAIKLLATFDNKTLKAMLPKLEKTMKDLDIEFVIEEVPFQELLDRIQSDNTDWNMFFMADDWHGDDPSQWAIYFSSENIPRTNVTRYSNPQVDQWLEKGIQGTDAYSQESLELYKSILLQLNTDLPELPIYTGNAVAVGSTKIQGIQVGTYQNWTEGLEGAVINK